MTLRRTLPCLGLILAALPYAVSGQPASPVTSDQRPNPSIMKVQVILDRLGFSPGVIDGRTGQTLTIALKGFQASKNLPTSGEIDPATIEALRPLAGTAPIVTVKLGGAAFRYRYTPDIPHDEDKQAGLPGLNYRNVTELLAERYHTTPETLIALNPPGTRIAAGSTLRVPNVFNTKQAYPSDISPLWRQTLVGLNVPSSTVAADHIKVSRSAKALGVYDANDQLLAQFPVTTGSQHDPLPLGRWKIVVADYNPKFHYNPALFWDAKERDSKAMLPPGPNGPVGVVWLDLSKAHYGIHGTPEPANIGRTASHGCVRLTNWDAARLSLMVKPGTPVIFEN